MEWLESALARRTILLAVVIGLAIVLARAVSTARGDGDALRAPDAAAVATLAGVAPAPDTSDAVALVPFAVADSMAGHSGKVKFRTLTRASAATLTGFISTFGEGAIRSPGVYRVAANGTKKPFTFIVLRPFAEKRGESLQGYRLGRWPSERWMMGGGRKYWNPDGFIEVTQGNEGLRLSDHFTLGEFLTHDQRDVWPKYVVLQEPLLDKLELVLADLAAHGVPTDHVRILSGFRAPYYNDRIVAEGAARASRHQYGDAADIIIDSDGDGRMDDLNHDGRLDLRDTQVILRSVERVEKAYPGLVGGLGLYHAMGSSGPFAHIDVRGTSARWRRE